MKKLILLPFIGLFAMGAYATNMDQGFKESNLASSYVKCALYAHISNMYIDKSAAVSEHQADKLRLLALKHWRKANELLGNAKEGDEEIIDFASYLSS